MASPQPTGMSLYANLLDANDPSAISRPPVLFKQDAPKKAIDPALQFQPVRRPQVKPAKSKAKPGLPRALAAPSPIASAQASHRNTLADWAAEDDGYMYLGDKRPRGGRRKKKRKQEETPAETDWDELYDPARPTNVDEYLRSEERIREVREWKALLYAHRRKSTCSSPDSDRSEEANVPLTNQFAPPDSLIFAPPQSPKPTVTRSQDAIEHSRNAVSGAALPPSSAPPPPPLPEANEPQPPKPPTETGAVISRAPVRYEASEPTSTSDAMDLDQDEEVNYANILLPPATDVDASAETPRSSRPGQAGFAQRLMSKYGWKRGSGLGVSESGITSALRVQAEKRRRKPDSEGGGFAEPGARGKIIGGKRKDVDPGGFGRMSEVIVLRNMLENMANLRAELEDGLGQEIGEECGEKYGRVERLKIDEDGRQVFIKFTDQVSALRAVNALEGRIFNGNAIEARFYDADIFEAGVYN